MSVMGTFHYYSSHFQKGMEESCGLVLFPIDYFTTSGSLQSRKVILKKKISYLLARIILKSFLLLLN